MISVSRQAVLREAAGGDGALTAVVAHEKSLTFAVSSSMISVMTEIKEIA
jgi:hypothetical protein